MIAVARVARGLVSNAIEHVCGVSSSSRRSDRAVPERRPTANALTAEAPAPLDMEQVGILSGPISRFASELASEGPLMAPVQLPSPSEITVRLVDRSVLMQLDQARDDVSLFQNYFFAAFGTLLGVVVTMFRWTGTDLKLDQVSLASTSLLIIFLLSISFPWFRASRRARQLRAQIFPDSVP